MLSGIKCDCYIWCFQQNMWSESLIFFPPPVEPFQTILSNFIQQMWVELLNIHLMTGLHLYAACLQEHPVIITLNDRLKEFQRMRQDEPTYIGACVLGAESSRRERCGRAEGICCWIM